MSDNYIQITDPEEVIQAGAEVWDEIDGWTAVHQCHVMTKLISTLLICLLLAGCSDNFNTAVRLRMAGAKYVERVDTDHWIVYDGTLWWLYQENWTTWERKQLFREPQDIYWHIAPAKIGEGDSTQEKMQ